MKKTVTYTIDENVIKAFNKETNFNSINKSKWIENKMKEYIEKEGKNE